MASLRELFITIGLDAQTEGFSKIERGLQTVKKIAFAATAAIGGLSAAVFATAKATADYADTIEDTAMAVGITNEQLQGLGFAAKLSGASLEQAADGLRFLARSADEAATKGTGPAAEAFERLGISAADSNGAVKDSDALMLEIADRFAELPNGAEKTAMAMDIFGRSGAKLIPMLNAGRSGINGMREEAARLGLVLDDQAIRAGSDFNDALDRLMAVFAGLRNSIGAAVLPALMDLVDGMREAIEANIGWIRSGIADAMNGLIKVVRRLGQFIATLASGFGWLTDKVSFLVPALKTAVALMGFFIAGRLIQGLAQTAQGFLMVARSIRVVNASALLIPILIGAAIALAVAVIEDFIAFTEGRPSVLGFLIENKDAILASIAQAFDQVIEWINAMVEQAFDLGEEMLAGLFQWAGLGPEKAREAAEDIIGVFRWVRQANQEAFDAMMEGFRILGPIIADTAKVMVRGFAILFDGAKAVFDTFLEGVKAGVALIGNLITDPVETVKGFFSDIARLFGAGPEFSVDQNSMVSPTGQIGAPSLDGMARGIQSSIDNRRTSSSMNMSPTINVSVQGGQSSQVGQDVANQVEETLGNIFRSVERSNKPAFAQ